MEQIKAIKEVSYIMNVTQIINEKWRDLSKQQKKLGNFFKENPERAAFMTAARVAKEAGVSEATVVRFAASLGFSGYQAFLKAMREETKGKLNSIKRMQIVSEKFRQQDILKNVLKADVVQIEKTLEFIDNKEFQKAIDYLIGAKTVYILALRSSAALAHFMGFYFNMLFENVKVISGNSAEGITEKMIRISEKDVVVGISFPRYSASVVGALQFAKSKKANVIAITDNENSPIVKYSDCCLFAKSEMDSFADSLVAPMSIINAIILAIGYRKKDELEQVFLDIEHEIEQQEVYDL